MVKSRLRIPHRRRWISVDGAEVSSAFNQEMPRSPPLPHPHQSGVDRHITVRMEIAHRLTDDLRTLHGLPVGLDSQSIHRVQNAALRGLQSVSCVG